jgi:hypothetical protein
MGFQPASVAITSGRTSARVKNPCYNAAMRIAVVLLLLVPSMVQAATLEKPIYAEVFLKNASEKVSGNVSDWDAGGATFRIGEKDRTVNWPEMTPISAFTLRQRLIDKTSATDWLGLGKMGWEMGLTEQGKVALNNAARIDPKLKALVDNVLSKPATRPTIVHASMRPTSAPLKYVKSTPADDAAAIATAQKVGGAVGEAMKIKFQEVQTPHFIVFTDWDPREFTFLKTNLEDAYSAVSRQFDIPSRDNVFVGKLPVFMFMDQRDFMRYAQQFDDLPANRNLLGYYASHGDGSGHMAMWKPRQQVSGVQGRSAEEQWAYTLTHEFTHAFVDRYRSNRRIPRWLNEGLAEVIAQSQFPQPNRRTFALEMAQSDAPIDQLFDDEQMPGGEYYPVMQTMVQMLIDENRTLFLKWFDAIKDGEKPEAALKKYFGVDYAGLVSAWKQYIVRG